MQWYCLLFPEQMNCINQAQTFPSLGTEKKQPSEDKGIKMINTVSYQGDTVQAGKQRKICKCSTKAAINGVGGGQENKRWQRTARDPQITQWALRNVKLNIYYRTAKHIICQEEFRFQKTWGGEGTFWHSGLNPAGDAAASYIESWLCHFQASFLLMLTLGGSG